MAVGMTLLKIGLTGATLAGVVLTAKTVHARDQRRLAERKSAQTRPLPLPPAPGGGNGHATPSPTPDADVDYPPSQPCLQGVYSRSPLPPESNMYQAASLNGRIALEDLRMHLDYKAQPALMLHLLEAIQNEPSVRSVMVRRALEDIAPNCDWWIDTSDMTAPQRLVFDSVLELEKAAERELDWRHPTAARKNMIPREYLGLPSTGDLHLATGQAVELLVVEGPQMRFGEHLIAKQVAPGVVQIWDQFRGHDVTPRFGHRHGFSVGTEVGIETQVPTSVYRVYPKEWA
jgi:hypothetical protein